jgi:hypothetical protein
MTTPANDYASAVAALRHQTLPAYVEYTEESFARGMANEQGVQTRVVVDSRTNKIVSRTPATGDSDNTPPTQRVFRPDCYQPRDERAVTWNGAIAITLGAKAATCDDDITFETIYTDPSSSTILGADGTESNDGAVVDLSLHYARFGKYLMPTYLAANVHGHGLLFWVRQRAQVTYSNYAFEDVRRQSP